MTAVLALDPGTQDRVLLRFTVPGVPVPKGRPRFGRAANGRPIAFTDRATAAFEDRVAWAGAEAMAGAPLLDEPLVFVAMFWFAVPPSWSKRKTGAALSGTLGHAVRPDLDNLLKSTTDALKGVVWTDDTRISRIVAEKGYRETPGSVLCVLPMATRWAPEPRWLG